MPAPRIVVLGSINMDLVIQCPRLAAPGETVIADQCTEIPGGKGANQAVAAAHAGGQVCMIGRVGDDAFADRLVRNLDAARIDREFVRPIPDCASGVAIVAVESSGENAIMVVPGANGRITPDDVADAAGVIQSADILLVQLEIPVQSVLAAISIAHDAGVTVVLDPAPMPPSFPEDLLRVDVICPNQSEAAAILDQPIQSMQQAMAGVARLHQLGAANVVITMGGQGVVFSDGSSTRHVAAHQITAIDTTAAGDAFAGALAVYLAEGSNLGTSARFASAAGAIAATRLGAQPAMPSRDEIEALANIVP